MNEQKPVINTQVTDYTTSKSSKTIKIAIVLTIVLLGAIVFMGLSVNNMIKKADNTNGKVDHGKTEKNTTKEVVTTKVFEQFPIDVFENNEMLLFKITNNKDRLLDLTLRLNLYVGEEIDETIDRTLTAIESRYSGYIIIKKADLGFYDKYDYTVNGSNSFYKSAVSSDIKLDKIIGTDDISYEFTNSTSESLSKISVICIYKKDGKVVDAKIKEVYGEKEKELFLFNQSLYEYDSVDAFINEAYYI